MRETNKQKSSCHLAGMKVGKPELHSLPKSVQGTHVVYYHGRCLTLTMTKETVGWTRVFGVCIVDLNIMTLCRRV
jgi:hypothetical protein